MLKYIDYKGNIPVISPVEKSNLYLEWMTKNVMFNKILTNI